MDMWPMEKLASWICGQWKSSIKKDVSEGTLSCVLLTTGAMNPCHKVCACPPPSPVPRFFERRQSENRRCTRRHVYALSRRLSSEVFCGTRSRASASELTCLAVPPAQGHTAMLEIARIALKDQFGVTVLGGFISPSHDLYGKYLALGLVGWGGVIVCRVPQVSSGWARYSTIVFIPPHLCSRLIYMYRVSCCVQ